MEGLSPYSLITVDLVVSNLVRNDCDRADQRYNELVPLRDS
jgi:hypothetical protein